VFSSFHVIRIIFFFILGLSIGVWISLDDDVSELLVGSIFWSSETAVITITDWTLRLSRECGDGGREGLVHVMGSGSHVEDQKGRPIYLKAPFFSLRKPE
jgi:uncharacterized membrane protein YczE